MVFHLIDFMAYGPFCECVLFFVFACVFMAYNPLIFLFMAFGILCFKSRYILYGYWILRCTVITSLGKEGVAHSIFFNSVI